MAELMSVRGYAKSRGIAHTSVDYQIRKGRIPKIGGKIDAEYADFVFREKVDQVQSVRGRGQQKIAQSLPASLAGVAKDLPDDPERLAAIRLRIPRDYNDAAYLQAVEELLKRRAANAEAEGKLTPTDKVLRAQFELARQVRDLMESIPARIQDQLAAEIDPIQCGRLLRAEIRLALESAAKQARSLTEEMDDMEALADAG